MQTTPDASTLSVKVSCFDGAETEFTVPGLTKATTVDEFISLLIKKYPKPIYKVQCYFPSGHYICHYPPLFSGSEFKEDYQHLLPVYQLTHCLKHPVRVLIVPLNVKLTIRLPDSQILEIEVPLTSTILPLVELVRSKTKLPDGYFRYKGADILSNMPLYCYADEWDAPLEYIVPPPFSFRTNDQPSTLRIRYLDIEREIRVAVPLSATGKELEEFSRCEFGIPYVCEFAALHRGRYTGVIEPHLSLSDQGVKEHDVIEIVRRLRGGGGPMDFVDVQNEGGLVQHSFSDEAPDWRICSSGINIEGKCPNKHCKAFNHMVISRHGFGVFDLLSSKAHCPLCKTEIVPVKPGFTDCLWRIISMKTSGAYHSSEWKKIEGKYETYDEAKAGMATFSLLHIEAQPLKRELKPAEKASDGKKTPSPSKQPILVVPQRCAKCLEELPLSQCSLLPCGHGLHHHCLETWHLSSHTHCPLCDAPPIDILPPLIL